MHRAFLRKKRVDSGEMLSGHYYVWVITSAMLAILLPTRITCYEYYVLCSTYHLRSSNRHKDYEVTEYHCIIVIVTSCGHRCPLQSFWRMHICSSYSVYARRLLSWYEKIAFHVNYGRSTALLFVVALDGTLGQVDMKCDIYYCSYVPPVCGFTFPSLVLCFVCATWTRVFITHSDHLSAVVGGRKA